MANIAYVRVSTDEQNEGRQLELLKEKGIIVERYYVEKISGEDVKNRPQLKAMLDFIREGDIVYIESISRLARSTRDFFDIMDILEKKGVKLVSFKEQIDTSTPQGRFVVSIFAALAELERETIRERQSEGIKLALKEQRPYGRPAAQMSKTFEGNYKRWKAGEIKAVEFMQIEGLKKATFYKLVKRYESR